MNVKRYDPYLYYDGDWIADLEDFEEGKWVKHEDYVALERQLAEAQETVRILTINIKVLAKSEGVLQREISRMKPLVEAAVHWVHAETNKLTMNN